MNAIIDLMEKVILVDEADNVVGEMEKMEAHRKGVLHRAFSVFVLDSTNRLLLQRRALGKYHSPGLWTNTCCSHPRAGESVLQAAHRRLYEEMGFDCPLDSVFSFIYRAKFDNGLTEHELDHVLIGFSDEIPQLNFEEVHEYKSMSLTEVAADIRANPEEYTVWFRIAFDKVVEYLKAMKASND
ncbi:MAG: isopentenyl-diphosphate Delta-isomerase [Bacteroidales bacterium]